MKDLQRKNIYRKTIWITQTWKMYNGKNTQLTRIRKLFTEKRFRKLKLEKFTKEKHLQNCLAYTTIYYGAVMSIV